MLSLGIAGVSTYLIKTFKTPEAIDELEQEAAKPIFKVLVAAKPIGLGTVIAKDMVKWQLWSEEALSDKFVVIERPDQEAERLKDFIATTARGPFVVGEPILAAKLFKRDEPGYLAGMLDAGMRAITIKVSAISSVAGFVFPGDHVDILLTHSKISELAKSMRKDAKSKGKEDDLPLVDFMTTTTETILKNVRVIAVGSRLTAKEKKPVVGKNMTFEVTPKQAELIAIAQSMGKLTLSLRSLQEASAKPSAETYSTDIEVSPIVRNLLEVWNPIILGTSPQDKLLAQREKELAETKGKLNRTQGVLTKAQQETISARQTAEQARLAEAQTKVEAEARIREAQEAAAGSKPVVSKPKPIFVKPTKVAPKSTISIYRGEAQSTEEVQVK